MTREVNIMRNVFYESCGWMNYRPFDRYALPSLVPTTRFVELKREQDGHLPYVVQEFRLAWPGHDIGNAEVPGKFARGWPGVTDEDAPISASLPVNYMLLNKLIPEEPPVGLAYHLAVRNPTDVPFPVAGLPAGRVREVLDVTFAIDPEYQAAISHTKWVAESHRHLPLFGGFDTSIRESLMEIAEVAVRKFFMLVGDCLYDESRMWWSRNTHWARLAAYLHWVGRTGYGLYMDHAGINIDEPQERRRLPDDVIDRMRAWHYGRPRSGAEISRSYAHVSGKDPCVMDGFKVEGPDKS